MASRVKEVICEGPSIGERRYLYFDYYNAVRREHEFFNYLDEEDRYVKELVDTKKVKVDIRFTSDSSFRMTIKTSKKYTFEDLERIGKAITKAIWNWETVIDTVRDYDRYFSCTYVQDNKPIKCIVENDFDEIKMDLNDYREAINRGILVKNGDFWQSFTKWFSYYKELLDENVMGLSIEVFNNYKYRVTTWVNNYNGLVRFFLDHYPEHEITDRYVVRNADTLAFFIKDAILKWNWKLEADIPVNQTA